MIACCGYHLINTESEWKGLGYLISEEEFKKIKEDKADRYDV